MFFIALFQDSITNLFPPIFIMELEHIWIDNYTSWRSFFCIRSSCFFFSEISENRIENSPKIERFFLSLTIYNIFFVLDFLSFRNIHPVIRAKKSLIYISADENRLQIIYPIIEIYIILYCYLRKIHCIGRDKKWKTEISSNCIPFSPDSENGKKKSHTNPHEPHSIFLSDDKEINIWILMRRIHWERIHDRYHLDSWNKAKICNILLCAIKKQFLMIIWLSFHSRICIKLFFVLEHTFFYFASCWIALTVRISSESVLSISRRTSSTRDLSYHIWQSELMSAISEVFFWIHEGDFFEKSIDHFRSTIIFWAVFFPIPGTEERILSSSNCIAFMRLSLPSPRRLSAVFPPTPLTFRRSRKRDRSSISTNPKSDSLTSVRWWWIHTSSEFPIEACERSIGDAKTSKPSPVPRTSIVREMPSIARIVPEKCQNIEKSLKY